MKKTKSKRLLTLVLVVVLVFALSVSAFATWSSFQGNQKNNGRITSGQPATGTSPTVTSVQLPINDPTGWDVYTGVDAASVIQSDYAFTLYNGGVTDDDDGGARMQATNVTNGSTLWNIQLDANASNDMQLSTPYYDSSNNVIYATVTYTTPFQTYTSVAGWTASGGASISSGTATFTGGNQSVYTSLTLTSAVSTVQVSSNLALTGTNTSTGYTVTLSNGNTTYTLVNNETATSAWAGTYYTYNGAQIPAGTYTLTYTINSITSGATATLSTLTMSRYDWRLYSVSFALTQNPVKSGVLASGEGQINTHINSVSNYLFFGGWGGDHSYYQYGPINGTASLKKFTPATQEDFYYAGASPISENNNNKVVFGSESGKVYVRPVGNNFDSATGSTINLAAYQPACGKIRSSICVVGSTWYLTSQGTGSISYLWRITDGATNNPTVTSLALTGNTTSTPVVSANGYVYVGIYSYFTLATGTGYVLAVPSNFSSNTSLITVYSGDPVQSSPIVYSDTDNEIDYVYFTTNASTGIGYCYSFNGSAGAQVWTAGGTSSNRYAVQGFSSENGYLVYGDDGGKLYIIH